MYWKSIFTSNKETYVRSLKKFKETKNKTAVAHMFHGWQLYIGNAIIIAPASVELHMYTIKGYIYDRFNLNHPLHKKKKF